MMSPSAITLTRPTRNALVPSSKFNPGGVVAQAENQAPRFGGPLTGNYKKLLNHLDFHSFGASSISQIQVIYATCIGWRLIAANERRKDSPTKSWNEVRENALRDSMGYLFWFFATPMLQRGILAYVTKKHAPDIGNSLYKVNEKVANGKGFVGTLKAWNPLYRVDIPSSEQVKNQMKQALQHLTPGEEAYQKTEAYYKKLAKYRNIATGLGLINTIALIGIGINLLNFYLTRKNMERRKAAMQKPEFPKAPAVKDSKVNAISPASQETSKPSLAYQANWQSQPFSQSSIPQQAAQVPLVSQPLP